jgi:Flp pilus assembly protein TadD
MPEEVQESAQSSEGLTPGAGDLEVPAWLLEVSVNSPELLSAIASARADLEMGRLAKAQRSVDQIRRPLLSLETSDLITVSALSDVLFKPPGVSSTGQEWADYGVVLDLLNRGREAVAALSKAIELGNTMPETYRRLGQRLLEDGAPDRAEEILRRGQEDNPHDIGIRTLLARVLEQRGRLDPAAEAYFEAGLRALLEESSNSVDRR